MLQGSELCSSTASLSFSVAMMTGCLSSRGARSIVSKSPGTRGRCEGVEQIMYRGLREVLSTGTPVAADGLQAPGDVGVVAAALPLSGVAGAALPASAPVPVLLLAPLPDADDDAAAAAAAACCWLLARAGHARVEARPHVTMSLLPSAISSMRKQIVTPPQ